MAAVVIYYLFPTYHYTPRIKSGVTSNRERIGAKGRKGEGPPAAGPPRSGGRLARTLTRMGERKTNYAAARIFFSFLSAMLRFSRER